MYVRRRVVWRLLLIISALNIVGIACFSAALHGHDPLTGRSLDYMADQPPALDSIGFALMLPGIFFATVAFLFARAFTWNDQTAHIVWYATGFAVNAIIAWKVGVAFERAR
ncbi:MAG TPA: hypothetical protein VD966_11855 [Pyrinomonadaceae bacterium]|nr:hypothetical protein [Pyrinomonadaceae bacterium]